jgi:VWA domain containing CoxE-like protein
MSDPRQTTLDLFDEPSGGALDEREVERAMRWRLVLGRFADEQIGYGRLAGCGAGGGLDGEAGAGGLGALLGQAVEMDPALEFIYDREFAMRSHRAAGDPGRSAGLKVPEWLGRVRELFPREAVEVIERDALVRYGMHELVTDPELLRRAEPTEGLLKAILAFKHMMKGEVLEAAREIVRTVVSQLAERLMRECHAALHGANDPERRPPPRTFHNTDWPTTIRRNLKHYDAERERLVINRVFFKHKQRKKPGWRIIVSVDQSGSMLDKLIHSAVMAAIFASLPAVDTRLVLWDTRIVDMTQAVSDPLEVLMKSQLGGGNDDQAALEYCASLITDPARTILVTVSDWYICVPAPPLMALAHSLVEAGVTCIGLSALDTDCKPVYNEDIARQLAGCGWYVAALTPKQLAEHVGKLIA